MDSHQATPDFVDRYCRASARSGAHFPANSGNLPLRLTGIPRPEFRGCGRRVPPPVLPPKPTGIDPPPPRGPPQDAPVLHPVEVRSRSCPPPPCRMRSKRRRSALLLAAETAMNAPPVCSDWAGATASPMTGKTASCRPAASPEPKTRLAAASKADRLPGWLIVLLPRARSRPRRSCARHSRASRSRRQTSANASPRHRHRPDRVRSRSSNAPSSLRQ